jgi:hypothetical protein
MFSLSLSSLSSRHWGSLDREHQLHPSSRGPVFLFPTCPAFHGTGAHDQFRLILKRNNRRFPGNMVVSTLLVICIVLTPLASGAGLLGSNRSSTGVYAAYLSNKDQYPTSSNPGTSQASQARSPLATLPPRPLYFEPNVGQADPQARFLVHGLGGLIFFAPSQIVLALNDAQQESQRSSQVPDRGPVHIPSVQDPLTDTVGPGAPAPVLSARPEPRIIRMQFSEVTRRPR